MFMSPVPIRKNALAFNRIFCRWCYLIAVPKHVEKLGIGKESDTLTIHFHEPTGLSSIVSCQDFKASIHENIPTNHHPMQHGQPRFGHGLEVVLV